jgi:hypothetical protein
VRAVRRLAQEGLAEPALLWSPPAPARPPARRGRGHRTLRPRRDPAPGRGAPRGHPRAEAARPRARRAPGTRVRGARRRTGAPGRPAPGVAAAARLQAAATLGPAILNRGRSGDIVATGGRVPSPAVAHPRGAALPAVRRRGRPRARRGRRLRPGGPWRFSARHGALTTEPHLVAALPFGFWVSLLGRGGLGRGGGKANYDPRPAPLFPPYAVALARSDADEPASPAGKHGVTHRSVRRAQHPMFGVLGERSPGRDRLESIMAARWRASSTA